MIGFVTEFTAEALRRREITFFLKPLRLSASAVKSSACGFACHIDSLHCKVVGSALSTGLS